MHSPLDLVRIIKAHGGGPDSVTYTQIPALATCKLVGTLTVRPAPLQSLNTNTSNIEDQVGTINAHGSGQESGILRTLHKLKHKLIKILADVLHSLQSLVMCMFTNGDLVESIKVHGGSQELGTLKIPYWAMYKLVNLYLVCQ